MGVKRHQLDRPELSFVHCPLFVVSRHSLSVARRNVLQYTRSPELQVVSEDRAFIHNEPLTTDN